MPIRVAIVDDSPFTCGLLAEYLADVPDVRVVGAAHSGAAAIELVKTERPDVLTLDVEMPDADGVSVLRQLMRETPLPVVMVSGLSRRASEITHTAISEGAVDFVLKYSAGSNLDTSVFIRDFAMRIRDAGRPRHVARGLPTRSSDVTAFAKTRDFRTCNRTLATVGKHGSARASSSRTPSPPVVVIGSSTGGPTALKRIFNSWPSGLDAAILIVQHMPAGFTKTLALQLDRLSNVSVREAQTGDELIARTALIAPGDFHLTVTEHHRIELTQADKVAGHRPSIDVTMRSVAERIGATAIGVILTGMGHDGTDGLTQIHATGGKTLAQDADSCVVNGMPLRAIEQGIVQFIGTPESIAHRLERLTTRTNFIGRNQT